MIFCYRKNPGAGKVVSLSRRPAAFRSDGHLGRAPAREESWGRTVLLFWGGGPPVPVLAGLAPVWEREDSGAAVPLWEWGLPGPPWELEPGLPLSGSNRLLSGPVLP